ncbi:TRAP transporter small permease subunit [Azospirillum brasilense]|uniref:TRAP transporter small permease subunit n=1 Tax=Azospirillum brasilense TaxID=192 RepID=UPI00190B7106|nr:TRAP transporter small permease [Azospirillum brasilense]MBK3734287.1 TRAP transporter small permease subunit [Azospirillum brasilense]
MQSIIGVFDRILFGGALLACTAAALLAVMLIVEVVTTSFFTWSQPWAIEYSGYLLAVILFAGSGWALDQEAHIRVSLLTARLPKRFQAALEGVTVLFGFGVALFMAVATAENALRSLGMGSVSVYVSHTPLALPQGFLALSMALLALGFLNRLLRLLCGQPALPARSAPAAVESV